MKADMGGAATVSAAFEAIARLKLPINVTALTPLCENMPSGSANKPGDVVTAMNGKTIEVSWKMDNLKNKYNSALSQSGFLSHILDYKKTNLWCIFLTKNSTRPFTTS